VLPDLAPGNTWVARKGKLAATHGNIMPEKTEQSQALYDMRQQRATRNVKFVISRSGVRPSASAPAKLSTYRNFRSGSGLFSQSWGTPGAHGVNTHRTRTPPQNGSTKLDLQPESANRWGPDRRRWGPHKGHSLFGEFKALFDVGAGVPSACRITGRKPPRVDPGTGDLLSR